MRRVLVPLLILVAGGGILSLLLWTRKAPQRQEKIYRGPLVEAVVVGTETVQIVVKGQGTVRPGARVDLVPQVAGLVVWKSAELEPGGYFSRGDVLFRIDPEDYKLGLTQTEAQVARAAYRLDLMRQEAALARQEWEALQQDGGATREAPSPLVLQAPQLRSAQADFDAAQAQAAEARLYLKRTEVHAPFDGRVRSVHIDEGQFVAPGKPVGQLYSTEDADIMVPVADEDMAWFDLSSPGVPGAFPTAVVTTTFGGRPYAWQGHMVRTEAEVDLQSRMVHLVVNVPHPYAVNGPDDVPLMAGMFVDVAITGKAVSGVRVLARSALRNGAFIWVVGPDGRLQVRPVQVVRAEAERVLVYADLA
ncbi:MAG: efflux RND transporter periplasmic adaptor subunit, partial [bacterium]|nr:efflux RND transporter periplasmic adaptor subunit [bacterium]